MPLGDSSGRMHGFQLWANLPRDRKMTPPKYRGVEAKDIPELVLGDGVAVKVIAGSFEGASGPVRDVAIEPEYLDVSLPAGLSHRLATKAGHRVILYVFEGEGFVQTGEGPENLRRVENRDLVILGEGESIGLKTEGSGLRFLLMSGKPIGEPVAWSGPIVMNTEEELRQAYEELERGTFIKGS
jgi:quercetin 2,3-dioxygenase